jgi:hypothetical protein
MEQRDQPGRQPTRVSDYPAAGLPAPSITAEVRQYMKATMGQGCTLTELSWACDWDPDTRFITGARLMGRGGTELALVILRDLSEGQLLVHSHPNGIMAASESDLKSAELLDHMGIGSAIVSQDAELLYVIREPQRLERPAKRRSRIWKVGRLLVIWSAPVCKDEG